MEPDLGVYAANRRTLISGYSRRIAVGQARLSILEDRHADTRTFMIAAMAIGGGVAALGVALAVHAGQRIALAVEAPLVAMLAAGVIVALGGLAGMGYGASKLGVLERKRSALEGFDVLGEADFATGVFTDRTGARLPLASVQPRVENRSDESVLVLAWPGRDVVIGNDRGTVGFWSPEELEDIMRALHRLGFARGYPLERA